MFWNLCYLNNNAHAERHLDGSRTQPSDERSFRPTVEREYSMHSAVAINSSLPWPRHTPCLSVSLFSSLPVIDGSPHLWSCSSDRTPSTAPRVSTNTVRRVSYCRPYSSDREIFFAYCYLGQGHASLKFSYRNLKKKFGKKCFPRGVRPPKFLKKWMHPP